MEDRDELRSMHRQWPKAVDVHAMSPRTAGRFFQRHPTVAVLDIVLEAVASRTASPLGKAWPLRCIFQGTVSDSDAESHGGLPAPSSSTLLLSLPKTKPLKKEKGEKKKRTVLQNQKEKKKRSFTFRFTFTKNYFIEVTRQTRYFGC